MRSKNIERIRLKLSKTVSYDEKVQLDQEWNKANATPIPPLSSVSFMRIVFYASIALGTALMVLSFLCERYPFQATRAAFALVVLLNLVTLIARIDTIEIIARWSLAIPLYYGMSAGFRLRQLRQERKVA